MAGPTRRTFFTFLGVAGALRGEWTQWRGPERDGHSTESGLAASWPTSGPKLLWKSESLGAGYASYSFSDGRIITQGQADGRQFVIALNEADGKQLWRTDSGTAFSERRGNGPRGTPTIDGERVYAENGQGVLVCLNAADGKKLWSIDLLKTFGASNIRWGMSESPLVDGEKLIVQPGGTKASIVALNKADGSVIWKSGSDRAGYSSVIVVEAAGVRQYITLTASAAVGVRASDGKELWRYGKVSNRTANVATPVFHNDHVFVSSDYGTGCALLKLRAEGDGVVAEEVYFNRDMKNHYSSSVLIGDYLYGYSSRILTCMQLGTGEVLWRDRSVGKGQVIVADGKLYLLGEDGVVGLAVPEPGGYREISRFDIGRGNFPTWTLPAISGSKLYLRDQEMLSCYDVRA